MGKGRTSAQSQREHAIGIAPAGTGSDGTPGGRAIKGDGGLVMAQTPAEGGALRRDPPFSRLDRVSCRNLLIDTGGERRKRLVPLFPEAAGAAFPLRAGPGRLPVPGRLRVGDRRRELFNTLDLKARPRQRKDAPHGGTRTALVRVMPGLRPAMPVLPAASGRPPASQKSPPRKMTEQAPPRNLATTGVLVGATGDDPCVHGRSGLYPAAAAGEAGASHAVTTTERADRRSGPSARESAS